MQNHLEKFQQQHGLVPDGKLGKKTLTKMKEVWGIKSDAQIAQLLGNIDNETGGFVADTENLNYTINGLVRTWPKRFTLATAAHYAKKPEKIANYVYANRMGNGSEATGDGWKYRGRGALQLTGRQAYTKFDGWLSRNSLLKHPSHDLVMNPELAADEYFWETALFYFTVNGLWVVASSVSKDAIKELRKRVNGGFIGLKETEEKVKHYYEIATR